MGSSEGSRNSWGMGAHPRRSSPHPTTHTHTQEPTHLIHSPVHTCETTINHIHTCACIGAYTPPMHARVLTCPPPPPHRWTCPPHTTHTPVSTPSLHSRVSRFMLPSSCCRAMALGFILYTTGLRPSFSYAFSSTWGRSRSRQQLQQEAAAGSSRQQQAAAGRTSLWFGLSEDDDDSPYRIPK